MSLRYLRAVRPALPNTATALGGLLLVVVLAACGRVGFDTNADGGTGLDGSSDGAVDGNSPQPDLRLLLPDEVANLVGYWRMDGNWDDGGPRDNHLVVLSGTPAFTAPRVGTAAGAFYDTSFVVTNRPSLEVPYLSFSVWFTSDLINTANSNSGHTLFRISCPTCGGDPEIDIAYQIRITNDGSIITDVGDAPAASVTADRWHHVVGVYAPSEARLYLDGEIVFAELAANPSLRTEGGILWVGQLWPNRSPLFNPQYLHGALDELAIWSSALSDADCRAIYANQRP
jgi:hypothetical protein